jgi:CheY-like chemotaxis protein/HPt (histidine-containing phosphotransfer) domain-containing protein
MEYADTIRKSGESLISLINDLLDFSKIESEKLELENKPFHLQQCLEDAIDLMAPRAIEKGLDLFYFVDPKISQIIYGDVTRLRQVLVNLISNAIKFTEHGYVLIRIVSDQSSESCLELHFSVSDTGIGISDDKSDKIFEAFSQADSSTTRKYGGTGLGLSISNKIVQQMGGRMWVETELGNGSTFHFVIQCQQTTVFPLLSPASVLTGKTLLVIDSNPVQQDILYELANSWGLVVTRVNNVFSAREHLLLKGNQTDLLLIHDEALQYELITPVLDVTPVPTVIITGFKQSQVAKTIYPNSIILMKPYRHEQLREALVEALSDYKNMKKVITLQGSLDPTLAQQYPLHILVAEDHPVNQKLAKALLEKMGYLPDIAASGVEVLTALESKRYDVIFMDVQMPEMDGLETTRQIINRWPEGHHPVIIAMTAYASQGDKASCLAAGMQDFIRKPILKDELQGVLKKWAQQLDDGHITSWPEDTVESVSSGNLLDMTLLMERVDRDPELLQDLVDLFIQECPKLLEQLRDAVAQREYQALYPLVHTLKGMCQNICVHHMSEIAVQMENELDDTDYEPNERLLSEWLRLLESDFELIRSYYQRYPVGMDGPV